MAELMFPTIDYYLDQSDPDTVILRRQDGSFVAAFSARGAASSKPPRRIVESLSGLTLTRLVPKLLSLRL